MDKRREGDQERRRGELLVEDRRKNVGKRSFRQQCIDENHEEPNENVSKYERAPHPSSCKGLVLII